MYPCITLWGVCQVGRRRKLLCGAGLSLLASEVWSFWHQCKKRGEQGPAELQGLLPPCKSLLHHVSSEKFDSCLSLAFRWTIQTIPALVVPWFTVFACFPSRLAHLFSAAAQMLILRAGRWALWVAGQGAGRGLGLTIPYPRAGLTPPTSLSEWINILTPPKSRAQCPSHSVSLSFTRFFVISSPAQIVSLPCSSIQAAFFNPPRTWKTDYILSPFSCFLCIWILWTFLVLQSTWDLFLPPQSTTQSCSKQ